MPETGEAEEKESMRAPRGAACYYVDSSLANTEYRRNDMTLCPIAIAVGCKKCPAFTVCPLKGVIGDYKKPDDQPAKPPADKG